jgi:hypothetical protein
VALRDLERLGVATRMLAVLLWLLWRYIFLSGVSARDRSSVLRNLFIWFLVIHLLQLFL